MHEQFKRLDGEIQEWMGKRNWGVTATHYDFDRDVLAWRHAGSNESSTTLRVSRVVMEDWDSGAVGVVNAYFVAVGLDGLLRVTGNVLIYKEQGTASIKAVIDRYELP